MNNKASKYIFGNKEHRALVIIIYCLYSNGCVASNKIFEGSVFSFVEVDD